MTMAFTPRSVIKCFITRRTAYFSRYGVRVTIHNADYTIDDGHSFYGDDGRKVRAEATAWAHERAEELARKHATAWQSVTTSRRSNWERR